ncbi:MAG: hypothetical protein AVDCRST_MAG09-286 [uncultured Sphingomonas sp.]|uniref:Uncharacterized protein n=1 Tax=uncultured Sphingomonas sp. TaxID=158754 RepID=A0A6J4SAI5_9SPHN|nr:DUF6445 family protein [uncultured Sphingomonas sp.]CAA9493720.1 MAG: hypothetical protein AVDCRST_MAG09-286 [uncultured Sphingomonas sp.]
MNQVKPELRRVGTSANPVVVIDGFDEAIDAAAAAADALGPFPKHAGNYYPGHRRVITEEDGPANAYVERLCAAAATFIAGAFDYERFDLLEASFSLVTTPPEQLLPEQRTPHFDSTDPSYLAILHYLQVPEGSGTAFYQQRSTGIEQVTESNVGRFVRAAAAEVSMLPENVGYIHGSNPFFRQTAAIEGVTNRLIIYRGSLLHSGIIPPDMNFSANPQDGRLTANIFVRGH